MCRGMGIQKLLHSWEYSFNLRRHFYTAIFLYEIPSDTIKFFPYFCYDNPSDVQIVQSFVDYCKTVIKKDLEEWDWDLGKAKGSYSFNGKSYSFDMNDQLLRGVFKRDAWFKNSALDRLFYSMLKPFTLDSRKERQKTVYCHFCPMEDKDNTKVIRAELSNEYTQKVDSLLFKKYPNAAPSERSVDEYLSIVISIDPDPNPDSEDVFLPELFHKNNALDYVYKPYLYQGFFDVEQIPSSVLSKINENRDCEFKLTVQFLSEEEADKKETNNYIVFAASPEKRKPVSVLWKELANKQNPPIPQNKTPLITSESNMRPSFRTRIDSIFSHGINLSIVRVGQANCILGQSKTSSNKSNVLFDCGIPTTTNIDLAEKGFNNRSDKVNYDFISHMRPLDAIFISHWDYDHYSGIFSLPRNVWDDMNMIIVAPDEGVSDFGEWGKTVVKYLASRNTLCLLKKAGTNAIFSNSYISIYHGMGTGKNDNSLLIRLKKTIIPGDCRDSKWPPDYGKRDDIEYVIVPHHGSKRVIGKSDIALSVNQGVGYKFIICAGFNNEYSHPTENWHMKKITLNSLCSVECTNIDNPEEKDLKKRVPNKNKGVIRIKDA